VFESVVFVINRIPSASNNISPFEALFQNRPNYKFFHVLGCACYPLLRPYMQTKLQPRSEWCVFLGYSQVHKGYYCLDPSTKRMYVYRHVQFDEHNFPFASQSDSPTNNATTNSSSHSPLLVISPTSIIALQHPSSPTISSVTDLDLDSSPIPLTPLSDDSTSPTVNSHSMLTRAKTNSLKPIWFKNHQVYNITS
jgi:hypothetical protein